MQRVTKMLGPTVFLGVYGTIDLHPWVAAEIREDEDIYRLFVTRSVAMGWTSTGLDGPSSAQWGMNDGDQDWTGQSSPARVAWLQVTAPLDEASGYAKRCLPIQPMLACTGDALRRVGRLSMTAVQLLLPIQSSGSAESDLMATVTWFSTSDPAARAPVRVTLDTGEGAGLRPLAQTILDLIQARRISPFTVGSYSFDESTAVEPQPTVAHDMWRGTDRAPVTFEAMVPEWSLDTVGWLVALFADACRHAGVETSVMVGVGRVDDRRTL